MFRADEGERIARRLGPVPLWHPDPQEHGGRHLAVHVVTRDLLLGALILSGGHALRGVRRQWFLPAESPSRREVERRGGVGATHRRGRGATFHRRRRGRTRRTGGDVRPNVVNVNSPRKHCGTRRRCQWSGIISRGPNAELGSEVQRVQGARALSASRKQIF